MPWNETNAMNEKVRFISVWLSDEYSIAELCRQFNITRRTGYKTIHRYETEGIVGLQEHSRAHYKHPNELGKEMVNILLKTKLRYPHWGPRKIKAWLELEQPEITYPASIIGELFKRHGMSVKRKKRLHISNTSQPFIACTAPNISWSADFKGQFKLGTKSYCYPLTISDNYSRYFLRCKCLESTRRNGVQLYFERLFKEYGLPHTIKTDNGIPFATVGIGGLSKLSIWWLKLGIMPERIRPGHPEENGRHERMHRTLKQEATLPAQKNLTLQQRVINRFIREYNEDRPHEGLGNMRPVEIYHSSERKYPRKLPELSYDKDTVIRLVKKNGHIKFQGQEIRY